MGTRVKLTRSGGLAGISMVASVDVDELPPATAEQVRSALQEVDFDTPFPPGGAPDGFQYDLEVTDDSTRSLTAHDPFVGPGLRALLDVLLPLAEPE
ncbi:MAG TPA: protealysin inhibitor emfourin [Acidimicrobiales bacterium]|nr:protealysin inhibitor emfourin [Acidimicrobiales bacterium]